MASRHPPSTAPPGLVAIMFVDQVASTRQCAELGDAAALVLHARLQRAVLRHITARGGWQANSTGDGALALFASPAASMAAAGAIQSELRAANRGRDHLSRTDVRIGIHVGEPLVDADGMPFGLCVNLASRICALAGAGDLLVSDLVRELLGSSDRHLLVAPRWVTLRGARHSTRLWRLPGTATPDGAPMADRDGHEWTDVGHGLGCRTERRTQVGANRRGSVPALGAPVALLLDHDGPRT